MYLEPLTNVFKYARFFYSWKKLDYLVAEPHHGKFFSCKGNDDCALDIYSRRRVADNERRDRELKEESGR